MEAIFTFVSEHYPTIGLLIVVAVIMYFVTMYHVSIQNTRKKADSTKKRVDELPCVENGKKLDILTHRVDELPCDTHKEILKSINRTLEYYGRDIFEVKKDITEIKMDMSEMKGALYFAFGKNLPFAKKKSPLSLTDDGIEMVTANHFDKIIDEKWSRICEALNNLNTKNPYDLQEFCISTVFADTTLNTPKFLSEKDIDRIKILSYKSGIPIFFYTQALGILIRDRYFAENGIDVDEIDMHYPAQLNTEPQE